VDLRLTRRAFEDLELDPSEYAPRSARACAGAHEVVHAFVERRGQSPIGQETTRLPASPQVVYNLHAGRWRGLTWHDEEADVVWLLGVGYHRSGERGDAYEVLKRRDEADNLFPEEQDYLDLEAAFDDGLAFVEAVAEEGPAILRQARERPGERVTAVIAEALDIGVLVEVVVIDGAEEEEVWVGIALPPIAHLRFPPGEWITVLLAGVLGPSANLDDVDLPGVVPWR